MVQQAVAEEVTRAVHLLWTVTINNPEVEGGGDGIGSVSGLGINCSNIPNSEAN